MLVSNYFIYIGKNRGMEWLTVIFFILNIKVKINVDFIYIIYNDCEKVVVFLEIKMVDWNDNN